MSPTELLSLVQERIKFCDEHPTIAHIEARVALSMPMPKSWRPWKNRARTPFGVCECYPSGDGKRLLIYPRISQVLKYLGRATENGGRDE